VRGTLPARLACALAAVALGAACGGDNADDGAEDVAPEPITGSQLEGVWVLESGDGMVSFSPDGRWAYGANGTLAAFPVDGRLDSEAVERGTYSVAGDEIQFRHEQSEECGPDETRTWRVRLVKDGVLESEQTSACDPRTVGIRSTYVRASPDSRLELDPPQTIPQPTIAADPRGNVRGVWAIPDTSTLVAFSDDGRYAWDDEGELDRAPVDSGTVVADASGATLTFTSGATTRRCTPGDALVLENARVFILRPAWGLTGTVAKDACGRVEGELVLLAISL
jgi:hypothetical protein